MDSLRSKISELYMEIDRLKDGGGSSYTSVVSRREKEVEKEVEIREVADS